MTTTPEISATAVPCIQCGYDLRATPVRCPECGMAIAAALAQQRGELFDPRRVSSIAGAFLCWTVALLMVAGIFVVLLLQPGPVHSIDNVAHVFLVSFIIGTFVFIPIGNGLLAHPLITHDPSRIRKYLRLILRLAALLAIPVSLVLCWILLSLLGTPHRVTNDTEAALMHLPFIVTLMCFILLFAWRLRDLARTAPALRPPLLQRLMIYLGMITLILLYIAYMVINLLRYELSDLFLLFGPTTDNEYPFQILLCLNIANMFLLVVLAWLQFRRTQTFYRFCKTQWAASLPPSTPLNSQLSPPGATTMTTTPLISSPRPPRRLLWGLALCLTTLMLAQICQAFNCLYAACLVRNEVPFQHDVFVLSMYIYMFVSFALSFVGYWLFATPLTPAPRTR